MAARGLRLPDSGENKEHLTANPQCSCLNCDSLDCFTKRQDHKPCSCLKCENSKTCLFFPHITSTEDKVKTSMEGDDIVSNERVKREITYEFNEVLKTHTVSKNMIDAMFSGDKDSEIAERDTNNQSSTPIDKVTNDIPHKEHDSSAAKLSAQIMDVPYENLHGILSKDSDTIPCKISVLDVLNKIRDAYKACSCKVCECLVGASLVPTNKMCKCEPCDCKDCMSFLTKFQYLGNPKEDPPDGCPCIRCTRSQCKGIVNKFDEPQICDCPPGHSLKCENNYTKPCNCEPCQCLECKATYLDVPKTYIVAPVGEQYQRHYCDCSPCECLECRGYGTPRTYVREAETNVNRHPRCQCDTCANDACIADGTQTCKCQRHSRVMVKPVDKDVRDYDIRAIITEDKVIRNVNSKLLRNSTIAMYAAVPNLYNNTGYQKECACEVCECVICNYKENAVDSIKSSRLFKDHDKNRSVANSSSAVCKCAPCECHVCFNKINDRRNLKTAPKSCNCGTCDCIKCDRVIRQDKFRSCVNVIKRHSTKESCRCSPCDCVKCIFSTTCAGDVCHRAKYSYEQRYQESKESIYPIKKAEHLTPSSFSCEILNNSNKYNGDREFVKDFRSISNTNIHYSNISSQKDSLFLTNTGTHTFPQCKFVDNQDKARNERRDDNIYKYNTGSHSKNILCSEISYAHSKTNVSVGSEAADYTNYEYTRAASFAAKEKQYDNSCDSGCGSYDYVTIFPESSKYGQNIPLSNQCPKAVNYYPEGEITNMALKINKNQNIERYNDKLSHHHHSFESDKKCFFSKENLVKEFSISKPKYHVENLSQEYGRQYWIKNIDVSVAVQDRSLLDTKRNCFINSDSKNNSVDNINTIGESDVNLSYAQNIGDHSLNLHSKRAVDLFNNEAYYEGVQKTLHRARAFSLELLKVLNKYERANNEFQSITQKLKASHASLFSENILLAQEGKEDSIICLSPESSDMKTEHEDDISPKYKSATQKRLLQPLSNDFKAHDKKDRCTQMDNSSILHFSNDSLYDEEIPDYLGNCCHKNSEKGNKKIVNECKRNIRGIKKRNKYSAGTVKQILMISKEDQNTTGSNRVMKAVMSTQTVVEGKTFEEAATDAISISTSTNLADEKNVMDFLPISKKNFYLVTEPVAKSKGICIIPSLQGDIKHAVRTMSIQTKNSNHKNKFVPHRNEALQNLQIEVQKLLGMPMLQNTQKILDDYSEEDSTLLPQTKFDIFPNLLNSNSTPNETHHDVEYTENTSKAKDCKSTKNCCDALKVNFLGLRRMSDHTVLVKWTPPRITAEVTGYELLVDGRPVQKILSPSRCVAVVTCLPHFETVLLTIRTITTLIPSGHFPSNTIVYHPRVK